jgi:uncharacterized protein (DUF983 family)
MSVFLFQNACPRCQKDVILTSFLKMSPGCRQCGYAYEADSSGAMALNYSFGALVVFPVFFLMLMRHASPLVAIGVPAAITAVLAPFTVRFSRLAWLHLSYLLNPTKRSP